MNVPSSIKDKTEEFFRIARSLRWHLMGECVFCHKIEENSNILYRDDEVAVFAPLEKDILGEGHLLVVPREHYEDIYDIPEEKLDSVIRAAKKVAERLEEAGFKGVNILHASGDAAQQSVPHFHLHIVPRKETDELDLWPETEYRENSYSEVYERIEGIIEE